MEIHVKHQEAIKSCVKVNGKGKKIPGKIKHDTRNGFSTFTSQPKSV